MDIRYHAVFETQEEGGYFVRFLDFEDIFTQGETEEECLFNAAEVLTGMLSLKLEDGEAIPAPSPGAPDSHAIAPDAKVPAKWRGIGIRIEDEVLVTPEGGEVLTAAVPKDADAVEAWMAG